MTKKLFMLCVLMLAFGARLHAQNITGVLTAPGGSCPVTPGPSSSSSSAVTVAISGPTGSVGFTIVGPYSGTMSFFASGNNGASWQPLTVLPSAGGNQVTSTTSAGLFNNSAVGGFSNFCALM